MRYSVFGSFITIIVLTIGSILVIYNAIVRIINPVTINYNGMIVFAIIGCIVNIFAAYFTKDGHSLNQKAVNLHMIEDVLGWLVVLIGAIIMRFTNINIIDPILSIFVALFILKNAIASLNSIASLFLEKTPKNILVAEIKKHIIKIKDVKDVHHIHIWSMDGINNYATMHVVVDPKNKNIKELIKKELKEHGINHTTIELEDNVDECHEKTCEITNLNVVHHHHHHH